MKLMANHSSATVREQSPHVNRTSRTNTIVNALRQRAEAVLNDESIDAQTRAILRYALETHDPWLARLVRLADAGAGVSNNVHGSGRKVEALAEIICNGGEEPAAALLVLMGTLQNSTEPKALANTVKHLAFTRCGELNLGGMVDAHIAILESELLRE